MATAIMTTKGQVTIPLAIRKAMGLKKGDRIEFNQNLENGRVELRRKTGSIKDIIGMFKYDGPPATLEQIDEAIGDAIVERYLRSQRNDD